MAPGLLAAFVVAAYLSGSVPYGFLIARARGVDVREVGSGNIGATNVSRALGKKVGALVLLLDAAKGAIPLALVRLMQLDAQVPFLLPAVGLAAIVGHCFPVWLRFRGGKGVATSLGVCAVADPWAIVIALAAFGITYGVSRIASLGSLVGALAFVVTSIAMPRRAPIIVLAVGTMVLITTMHHQNIRRLLRREEPET